MKDVTDELRDMMCKRKCSAFKALYLIMNEENENVHKIQCQPIQEKGGGLCDKGNIKSNRNELG